MSEQPQNEELPFDTSDPKAVKAKIKSAKQSEALLRDALRGIMSSEAGRAWVHHLLNECHPFRSPLSSDPHMTYHAIGEANIGLKLIADLHACSVELYLQMMKENSDG